MRGDRMMGKEKTSICFTSDIGFDKHMDNTWKDGSVRQGCRRIPAKQ